MNQEEQKKKYSAFISDVSEILGLGKPIDVLKLCMVTDRFFKPLQNQVKELEAQIEKNNKFLEAVNYDSEKVPMLEAQIEKLIDFVLPKTECCDVCPITDTCINSEGTCPYAGILAKGEEEVTREWLMQIISRTEKDEQLNKLQEENLKLEAKVRTLEIEQNYCMPNCSKVTELKSRDCWKECLYASGKSELIHEILQQQYNLTKAKELLNEFMRISKASDEDFEHDYSELIGEAETFLKE